jgi:hypothetical protein
MGLPHDTTPVRVWVDIDTPMVEMVVYLNTLPGLRTISACQGTIGEGGPNPYGPYVMAQWPVELELRLREEFEIELVGTSWGYIRPRK